MWSEILPSSWTGEQWNAGINLFCGVIGIGSVTIAGKFALAGPVFATLALLLVGSMMTYTGVLLSRCMSACPRGRVQTYPELGGFVLGRWGHHVVAFLQLSQCLQIPTVYLVLSGQSLLPQLFAFATEDIPFFTVNTWIVLMALSLLPIVLIPTLKQAVYASLVGCLGVLAAVFVAVGFYMVEEQPWDPAPTAVTFQGVLQVFGAFSLAFGGAIIVPAIHRDMEDPDTLQPVIVAVMMLNSVVYLFVGVFGFAIFGCRAPDNLLFELGQYNNAAMYVAYAAMELGLAVSFAVMVNPAMFFFEKLVGIHQLPVGAGAADVREQYYNNNSSSNNNINNKHNGSNRKLASGHSRTQLMMEQGQSETDVSEAKAWDNRNSKSKTASTNSPSDFLSPAVTSVAASGAREFHVDTPDFTRVSTGQYHSAMSTPLSSSRPRSSSFTSSTSSPSTSASSPSPQAPSASQAPSPSSSMSPELPVRAKSFSVLSDADATPVEILSRQELITQNADIPAHGLAAPSASSSTSPSLPAAPTFVDLGHAKKTRGPERVRENSTSSLPTSFSSAQQAAASDLRWATPRAQSMRRTLTSAVGMVMPEEEDVEFSSFKRRMLSMALRTAVVAVLAFLACLLQNAFTDFADFIGATGSAASCLILPCIFYYKMFKTDLNKMEIALLAFILVISALLSMYNAFMSAKTIINSLTTYELFAPADVPPGAGVDDRCVNP